MWLVLLGACARPVVEEEQSDAAQNVGDGQSPEEDAEEPMPGQDAGGEVDAGMEPAEAGEPEAGCTDTDEDTVCDPDDNCPEASNTNQADADDDGIGDACDQPAPDAGPVACTPDAIPTSVQAGDVTLSNVRVNGGASPASVQRGQRVSVTLDYVYEPCSVIMTGQLRSMVIGYDGQSSGSCSLVPEALICPSPAMGTTTLMIDAPNRSGLAYVSVVGHQSYSAGSCSDSLSGAKRVAALCVR